LEQIIAALQEAVYVVDAEGRIIFCNPALAQVTGVPVEMLLGQPFLLGYALEARPVLMEQRPRVLRGEPVASQLGRQTSSERMGLVCPWSYRE
jgi:PAS domain S-box-containing protein